MYENLNTVEVNVYTLFISTSAFEKKKKKKDNKQSKSQTERGEGVKYLCNYI